MQVKKIACLIPTLQIGGSERVIALLAREFAKRSELEVHVVVYGREAPFDFDLSENVTIHRPGFEFDSRLRLLSTLRRLHFLRCTLKHGCYDTALSFGERWNSFVMLAALGLNQRVYLSDRSSPDLDLGLPQTLLRKLLYPMASGLIAQTSQARDMAIKNRLNGRIRVVPNPVVERQLAPDEQRKNVILCVGRMIATKNYDRLLKVFLPLSNYGWKLVIVGGDSQGQSHLSRLQSEVSRLQITEYVEFAGQQSGVQRFYDRAKIFAFTSSSEGFPNVVAEALSAGLPVVSYDCVAGPADLITNGENGFLVDLFDDNAFREKLLFLMSNEARRCEMSINARESVARLAPSTIARRVLDFMEEGL